MVAASYHTVTPRAAGQFRHDTVAVVYDFDGTLTPLPMQEYTVLPHLDLDPVEFWDECTREAHRSKGDRVLTYMRLLLEKLAASHHHLSRTDLRALGANIQYFPGVDSWFDRINSYIARLSNNSVRVKHYIVSAGMKEILEGATIRRHFSRVYASEYYFSPDGIATFPNMCLNDVTKTQFLFRINKGREEMHECINEHMPEENRAIPFTQMIYIGDGLTDVPSMTVVKGNGGHAIAVDQPGDEATRITCRNLFRDRRIDFFANADYRDGSDLDRRVKLILDLIVAKIRHAREMHACRDA